ncbi:MAG: methylated-DNA--[protein]-cysteine S-methyltransferase [Deltaproteobacteria bacterium]|jgi:methylated-DNA-[protein]-cysteine S-methyltransferase|nr:methylated-DNA--[protein]-cysteine S-methyltransferase [Deltaproteobacteria bacterium]
MTELLLSSPVGTLWLQEENHALVKLEFADKKPASPSPPLSPLLREAAEQLKAYFNGKLKNFTLPLRPRGTPFMLAVWEELRRIPYGRTASYKEIALRSGRPLACRAVGQANHKNPLAIVIPCHRVIGHNRKLVGYAGGLGIKTALLRLEGAL